MDVITDGLLIAGAVFAGVYCWVLSRRVQALKSLDSGLGGAIVTLTRQIELARGTLDEARVASRDTRQDLGQLIARSDAAAAQLRLLLASIETAKPDPATVAEWTSAQTAAAAIQTPGPQQAPAPQQTADPKPLIPRRRDAPGPRLVAVEDPEPEPLSHGRSGAPDTFSPPDQPDEADDGSVPKPRRTLALDTLLRRRPAPAAPAVNSEADLIAALSALATGGER